MRIFYVIDGQFLAGGQWVNLDHVEALRRLGYDARLWVMRPDEEPARAFRPTFPPGREAPWQLEVPDLAPDDVLVMGEMFGSGAVRIKDVRARKVIHNQGPYYSFRAFIDLPAYRGWGAEAMICPSHHGASLIRRIGWDGPLHVVRPALDPIFAPALAPAPPRRLQIAAPSGKRAEEIRLIRGIFRSRRPDLAEAPWIGFHNRPRAEVAQLMRESEIFLAAGLREGLGLPPLEAMWSGALVAGFHGGGGKEYATAENGDWFDDDQHVEIAEALISLVDRLAAGERFEARRAAGRRTAELFSHAAFEQELAAAWAQICPRA